MGVLGFAGQFRHVAPPAYWMHTAARLRAPQLAHGLRRGRARLTRTRACRRTSRTRWPSPSGASAAACARRSTRPSAFAFFVQGEGGALTAYVPHDSLDDPRLPQRRGAQRQRRRAPRRSSGTSSTGTSRCGSRAACATRSGSPSSSAATRPAAHVGRERRASGTRSDSPSRPLRTVASECQSAVAASEPRGHEAHRWSAGAARAVAGCGVSQEEYDAKAKEAEDAEGAGGQAAAAARRRRVSRSRAQERSSAWRSRRR